MFTCIIAAAYDLPPKTNATTSTIASAIIVTPINVQRTAVEANGLVKIRTEQTIVNTNDFSFRILLPQLLRAQISRLEGSGQTGRKTQINYIRAPAQIRFKLLKVDRRIDLRGRCIVSRSLQAVEFARGYRTTGSVDVFPATDLHLHRYDLNTRQSDHQFGCEICGSICEYLIIAHPQSPCPAQSALLSGFDIQANSCYGRHNFSFPPFFA